MHSLQKRFWSKVDLSAGPFACWTWTASKNRKNGYGWFGVWPNGSWVAHRVSYELCVGPVPDGLDLDHLCRNRYCVNPFHLEPVTRSENLKRGTVGRKKQDFCRRGHTISTLPSGRRRCRKCDVIYTLRSRACS